MSAVLGPPALLVPDLIHVGDAPRIGRGAAAGLLWFGATPAGTGDAYPREIAAANPVASPGSSGPSQRALSGGLDKSLRYVLIPWETTAPLNRSDCAEAEGAGEPPGLERVWDARHNED